MNEMGSFIRADQTASKICQCLAIVDMKSLQVSSQPGFIVDDFPGSMIAGEMFTSNPPTEQQPPASQEQALSEAQCLRAIILPNVGIQSRICGRDKRQETRDKGRGSQGKYGRGSVVRRRKISRAPSISVINKL
jgi:hypothetical protein